jgi:hypothetical protein
MIYQILAENFQITKRSGETKDPFGKKKKMKKMKNISVFFGVYNSRFFYLNFFHILHQVQVGSQTNLNQA